jgi:hypothetical protein
VPEEVPVMVAQIADGAFRSAGSIGLGRFRTTGSETRLAGIVCVSKGANA